MWNNHSIRRQKLGDRIPGILYVLFHNPEIFGASKYLYTVPENMSISLLRLVRNDHLQMDGDFMKLASSIIEIYGLSSPYDLIDWTTARHLKNFLSEIISYLFYLQYNMYKPSVIFCNLGCVCNLVCVMILLLFLS